MIDSRSRESAQKQSGLPRTETADVETTPLDLSIAKGASFLGVSSRLSINIISPFELVPRQQSPEFGGF